MKGVGWETEGCLNITQAKKAGELLSDVSMNGCLILILRFVLVTNISSFQTKYRQKADSIKFTQVADDLSMKHAQKSQELQSDVRPPLQSSSSGRVTAPLTNFYFSSWRTKQTRSR